jgi:hypothetical protein
VYGRSYLLTGSTSDKLKGMNAPAISIYIAKLPAEFFIWWFLEAPATLFKILKFIFLSFAHLFSFKELFATFFKPWKNEYREGLVKTAVFIGAFIKSILIIFDAVILSLLIALELIIFVGWIILPFLVVYTLYGAIFA